MGPGRAAGGAWRGGGWGLPGGGGEAGSGNLARRMFDALSDRFDGILKRLRGKGRLSEADVDEVLAEIRTALLEADVNVRVVRQVIARIREQVVGLELSKALSPSVCLSCRRLAIAPTIVTSTPSRIHTVPRPKTTSQCQRLHGSRSIRPGMRVVMVSPALAAIGHGLPAAQRRHAPGRA